MKVRRPREAVGERLPRWWYHRRPVPTHWLNAVLVHLPWVERLLVKLVRRHVPRLDSAQAAQARLFCAQEAVHAAEHQKALALLDGQGLGAALEQQSWRPLVSALMVRLPPRLSLACAAAAEHIVAEMSVAIFRGGHPAHIHPAVRPLLVWHFAEEIEHRSVVFDILVARGGGWWLRLAGLVLALVVLGGLFWSTFRALIRADQAVTPAQLRDDRRWLSQQPDAAGRLLWRSLWRYLRPGFHPSQIGGDEFVEAILGERNTVQWTRSVQNGTL